MFGEGLNHKDSSLIDMANRLYLSVNFLQLEDWENAYNNNKNMLKALAILRNEHFCIHMDIGEIENLQSKLNDGREFMVLGNYILTTLEHLENYYNPIQRARIFNISDSLHKAHYLNSTEGIVIQNRGLIGVEGAGASKTHRNIARGDLWRLVATLDGKNGWRCNEKLKGDLCFQQICRDKTGDS